MTQPNGFTEHEDDHGPAFGLSTLLTPKASAITGFTLAVFSMMGQGSWTIAVQSFFGTNFGPQDYATTVLVVGVVSLALATGALLLARQVLLQHLGGPPWEDHLARAAVVIAGLGAVFAVVTIVGGIVARS